MKRKPITLSVVASPKQRLEWWKSLAFDSRIGVSVPRVDGSGKSQLDSNGRAITDGLANILDAKTGRKIRTAPKRGPSRGDNASITREQIAESVERHKLNARNLEDALNKAADELGKIGSREYKDLHRWYRAAKES